MVRSVHPREVVKECLAHNCAAVIFAHCHPSGEPSPSQADELITRRLREALALVDIRVLDHLLGGNCCVTPDYILAESVLCCGALGGDIGTSVHSDTFWSLRAIGGGAALPMPFDFTPSVSPSRRCVAHSRRSFLYSPSGLAASM